MSVMTSSASLAFLWEIIGWPVNSPHKGPLMQKMFPFDDFIMGFAVLFEKNWNLGQFLWISTNKLILELAK